jgi:D-alanyl-D-alanine carboxypeptidase
MPRTCVPVPVVLLLLASAPAQVGGQVSSLAATSEGSPVTDVSLRLERLADRLAAEDRFSGVILLARGDSPVLARAWGLADRDRRIPNTVDTRFNIGSINKIFTAAAIHQLASEGRLSLDDTLGAHLAEYPDPTARSQITIRHLLAHRSGIGGNIFRAPDGGTRDDLRTTGDFLALFAGEPLRFPPGSSSEYSNAGYVILGAIVERVSGGSYYDFVQDRLFRPLGMADTGHLHRAALPEGTAVGYTRGAPEGGALVSNHDHLPGRGSSAGGGYSTAADLLRFALAAGRGEVPGVRGGLGIGGGAPGLNAVLEMDMPGGYHLVVLANMDPPAAERIAEQVRGWLGAG